jgi:hypothetical protein
LKIGFDSLFWGEALSPYSTFDNGRTISDGGKQGLRSGKLVFELSM